MDFDNMNFMNVNSNFTFSNLYQLPQKKKCILTKQFCAKSFQSCATLRGPVDCSLPCSSVHGILQARMLEQIAFPPPGGLFNPGMEPASLTSPALTGRFFTTSTTWEVLNNSTLRN